ncbi:4Fe-4S ferredoxin [candidate division KSB1 bacterium]|nr:MAG: 4Fe-4S ferredoxin [candidate division KSB1 bacterium]
MFSRNNLKFYPDIAKIYYTENPDKEIIDRQIHEKIELCEEGSKFYDFYISSISKAAFNILERSIPMAKGEKFKEKNKVNTEQITKAIKKIAVYYGAVDVGITKLKDYHFYSYKGRQYENWGKKVNKTHKYGVVIIVPMDSSMLKKAPFLPVLLESGRSYVEAAKIAHIIAEYIRSFGYDARSHTDGNYEVMCVPLAYDAGLGEVGRSGILIHPVYGPCIRISAVTTELELIETKRKNYHIENFCIICKKCADNCPTSSINKGNKKSNRGFKHWFIKQETCYSFWKTIGTDCGICIRVCPYSKPDTFIHRLVRFYVSRNPVNQRIALFFDDLFYGRKIKNTLS